MPDTPAFITDWSAKARAGLQAVAIEAFRRHRGVEFIQIVLRLNRRLRNDPLEVGEPYRHRGNVFEHHAVDDFISIDFAIDTERKAVLVRDCSALSWRDS